MASAIARHSAGGLPWRVLGWGLAALILAVPAAAMLFTREVNWGPGDFIIAAGLLGLTGLAIELGVRAARSAAARWLIAAAALMLMLVVWAELAVGIF